MKTIKNAHLFLLVLSLMYLQGVAYAQSVMEMSPSEMEKLKTLPYANWIRVGKEVEKRGVVKYRPSLAFHGVNVYISPSLQEAYLMGMKGGILHRWSLKGLPWKEFYHIKPDKDGNLFAMTRDTALVKLGWNSELVWGKEFRCHHDFDITKNGDIYLICRKGEVVEVMGEKVPLLVDYIVTLSPEGQTENEISIFKVMEDQITWRRLREVRNWAEENNILEQFVRQAKGDIGLLESDTPPDIFHTNSIQVAPKKIRGLCRKGDILISIREYNLIGIIDKRNERLIWSWGPDEIEDQHHPTFLDNGNILVFDNGIRRGYSRILEIDPLKNAIVWSYKETPPKAFFSPRRGSCQKLPNGNVLITESNRGRAFEVTQRGEIVWEFYNPVVQKKKKRREAIHRLIRLVDFKRYPFLRRL